jgi:hypothetical protein
VHLPNIKEKIPRAAPTAEVYFNRHSESGEKERERVRYRDRLRER